MAGLAETSGTAPATPTPVFNADDLFYQKRGTEYTYVNSYTLNYAPSATINDYSLTYEVPALSAPNCIFLSDMCLRLSVKLVDKDGKPPEEGSLVSVVNLFTANIFRNLRMFLNEVECSSSDAGTYGLKSYTAMLTGVGFGPKHGGGAQQYAYYEDRPREQQEMDLTANGFLLRALLFGELEAGTSTSPMKIKYSDKPVEMYAKLLTDFSNCTLPMISGVSVRLEMNLQEPSYYVLSQDANAKEKAYRLKIVDATLVVPVKVMSTGLSIDLEKKLSSQPISFGLGRIETKKVLIPAGGQSFTSDSLFQSSINPDRLCMVLVSSTNWDGGYKTNPLCFDHSFKNISGPTAVLTRALLTINGQPLDQDPTGTGRKMRMSAFRALYRVLGLLDKREDCSISYEAFENGSFMLWYDLTASGRAASGPMAKQPPRQGHVRLELNFNNPLPKSVYLFVFAEYNASLTVDKNRNIKYSFIA